MRISKASLRTILIQRSKNYPTHTSLLSYGNDVTKFSYSLILFIEKVAFDSHSLIEHDHEHGHDHAHSHGHDDSSHDHKHESKKVNDLKVPLNSASHEMKSNQDDQDEGSDDEEEALKNVVSSKGKFASFLQQRNILTSGGSMVKPDKALLRASQILSKTNERDEMNALLVSPQKVDLSGGNKEVTGHVHTDFVPKSNITPYLLLIALSFHGFFEGVALGLQRGYKDTLFLFIAIISHKWAESFTLGISFSKAGTDRITFVRLILLFAFFTPLGIVLGIFLTSTSKMVEAIFLALSTGKIKLTKVHSFM
jgi:zinc transporter ZupT